MEDNFKQFQEQNNRSREEIENYREAFRILDLKGGGTIERDELHVQYV